MHWKGVVALNTRGWLGFGLMTTGGGRYVRCEIHAGATDFLGIWWGGLIRSVPYSEMLSVGEAPLALSTPLAIRLTLRDAPPMYLRVGARRRAEMLDAFRQAGVDVER